MSLENIFITERRQIMNEVWKDISNYEGYYKVSNYGRIMNMNGLILRQRVQNSGYLIVHLYKNRKRVAFTVHRIVAHEFIENIGNKEHVNHKDGNKRNNNSTNLEWCTPKENMKHASKNGLLNIYDRTDRHRKAIGERSSRLFKGVKKTPEHNKKNSDTHKGMNPICNIERRRKDFVKVLCVETGEIFLTIKDAADSIGCNKDKLWRHLRFGTKYEFITANFKIIQDGSKSGGRKK